MYRYVNLRKDDFMSKTLVLAEKPSVARDIARVLNCNKKLNGALKRKPVCGHLGFGTFGNFSGPREI